MTKESKRNQELLHMEISNSVSLCWVTADGMFAPHFETAYSSNAKSSK